MSGQQEPPSPRPATTLGVLLDAAGRTLLDRHRILFPWTAPLGRVLERAERTGRSIAPRFERRPSVPQPDLVGHGVATPPWSGGPAERNEQPGLVASRSAEPRAPLAEPNVEPHVEPHDGDASAVGPTPAVRLPADVRARLHAVAGPGADVLGVRQDAQAQRMARRHHADAVTTGNEVLLRTPPDVDGPSGFALMAHEATHVTAALTGRAVRRASPVGAAAEEEEALATEARAYRAMSGAAAAVEPVAPGPIVLPQASRGSVPGPPAALPMAAHVDRRAVPSAAAALDVEELRRSVVDELMRRLRTEFERGA